MGRALTRPDAFKDYIANAGQNAGGMARELAALEPESTNQLDG
jgi:hypothetical protein